MRAVVQRVERASVTVAGDPVAAIGRGLLILLGVGPGDGEAEARSLAEKIAALRIFEDAQGKTNLSALEVGGAALVVSQFTLYADTRKGRRPAFTGAAPPEIARPLVLRFTEILRLRGLPAQTGEFGAHMQVELVNDGPFTLVLDQSPGGTDA